MSEFVTDNTSNIIENTLHTEDRGGVDDWVIGQAYTYVTDDGYQAQCGVTSYEYAEGKTRHVPGVALIRDDGTVAHEQSVRDSADAQTAIERALEATDWVLDNRHEVDN